MGLIFLFVLIAGHFITWKMITKYVQNVTLECLCNCYDQYYICTDKLILSLPLKVTVHELFKLL